MDNDVSFIILRCFIFIILLTSIMVPILPYLLAFAAGAMIYVVVEELIPELQEGGRSNIGIIGVAFGFVIMMILDVALGYGLFKKALEKMPLTEVRNLNATLNEKAIYGKNVKVLNRANNCVAYQVSGPSGNAVMTSYSVFPGIKLV